MVNLVIRLDQQDCFRFASLQSSYAKEILQTYSQETDGVDSFIYIENNHCYTYSTAVGKVLLRLSWYGYILGQLWLLIPIFLRDPFYRWIARNRYRWFGQRESCRMPSAELKKKFLSE